VIASNLNSHGNAGVHSAGGIRVRLPSQVKAFSPKSDLMSALGHERTF